MMIISSIEHEALKFLDNNFTYYYTRESIKVNP